MYRDFIVCLFILLAGGILVSASSTPPQPLILPAPTPPHPPPPRPYIARPKVIQSPRRASASASALGKCAAAKASASRIDSALWRALDAYGYQVGAAPLLAPAYGALSRLYAASLPARSFVGSIDPVFANDYYHGNVKFVGRGEIAVIAI